MTSFRDLYQPPKSSPRSSAAREVHAAPSDFAARRAARRPERPVRRATWTPWAAPRSKDLYANPAASPSPRGRPSLQNSLCSKEKFGGNPGPIYTSHWERRRASSTPSVVADSVQPKPGEGRRLASPPQKPHLDIPHISPWATRAPPLLLPLCTSVYSNTVGGLQGVRTESSRRRTTTAV